MPALRGLYGMVDVPVPGRSATELAAALVEGGACALQLRDKHSAAANIFRTAQEILPLARAAGIPFIVNDRLDVALLVGADGVHVGQDDLPLAAVKRLAPAGFIVGVSTHNLAQAQAAVAGGADYLGFGPCFATTSKARPDPVVTLDELAAVCRLGVPVVAIGGITVERAREVARAGAPAAATIAAVNHAADVVAAARAFATAFSL